MMQETQTNPTQGTSEPTPQQPAKEVAPVKPMSDDVKKNKDMAGLSYIPPISLFAYFGKKDSPFVHENAKQGLGLLILLVFGWIIAAIPVIGFIGWFLLIISFIYMILGFMKAFTSGETINIPMVSEFLKKHEFEDIMKSAQGAAKGVAGKAASAATAAATKAAETAKEGAAKAAGAAKGVADKAVTTAKEGVPTQAPSANTEQQSPEKPQN